MTTTDDSLEERRFFFLHLQKTAGTVMKFRLMNALGDDAVYPNPTDGNSVYQVVVDVDHLRRRFRERGREIRVVTGHFPLCTTELLGARFTTFTVLREPVERTLSYLRHHREMIEEDGHKSLEAIYDDPFRFQGFIHNHMVKMLSLRVEDMTAGMLTPVAFTDAHLHRATEALEGLDAVGFQERVDEFCGELNERFGLRLPLRPRHANRTSPVEVSDHLRDRILEDNALDVALYDHATSLVAGRAR